ncbi:MAG TPA: DNA-3-methyladenine glycosylase 2 family protein [Verrucomicrobiae bacterium]|jgi:3-methyladenine DNA glycosylase/8-oxoguanine DNA glycosylase|nr:DNA-3-methyladenine glycosylase 2 family protein [Verrucomicrobiae bacterium]
MSKRAITHLRGDPIMFGLIEKVGPIRFRARRHPLFQALSRSIIYQQLSGKAAGTILGRFEALFEGGDYPAPQLVAKASLERLRSAGLSRPKATYIIELAQHCEAGLIPSLEECDAMTDEQLIARLTEIKGIGRWTVEMLLMFNLGRPDVLPTGDLGVRRGFQIAYGKRKLPEPEHLAEHGLRWAPHRTMAARYLWRAADAKD